MRKLPVGTVTFLFTDVEGSTRLLRELGADGYAEALAAHRRVLRQAFGAHGGIEVDTQGDSFFVAFPTAPGALRAAAEARERFADGPICVRMGIHTGTPHVAEEGYVGVDVNRAARIAASGHGGQVLVSASTAALLGTEGLRDLGEHRLKDLSAPERIYQLAGGDFPPLKSLYQTNLPVPSTPFLGRSGELGEVVGLLSRDDVRLVTLTGPGGTGKTRLGLQAAGEVAGRFPDGIWWVPLAALHDPALVLETAEQALGAKDGLAGYISDRSLLLLFDNFEHVVEAASDVAGLLASCPNLALLVTSRESLRITGEQEYPVPPLVREEGVDFFVARARAVRPDFEPDGAVSEICRRLDSLPLALELAAARVRILPPAKILERLEQRLDVLSGGPRDAPARQRTLRATIDWSYELLEASEQQLFARLAIFSGSFSPEAAESIADAPLETLAALTEKSLLRPTSTGRLFMLETIREYAGERLEESASADEVRQRHAMWCLDFAEACVPGLAGPDQLQWIGRVEAEQHNLVSALDWALSRSDPVLGLRLLGPVMGYWLQSDAMLYARRFGERGLQRIREAPAALQAKTFGVAGLMLLYVNELGRAREALEASVALWRDLGDDASAADAIDVLAMVEILSGNHELGARVLEESIAMNRELTRIRPLCIGLNHLGIVRRDQGRLGEARKLLEESVELAQREGDIAHLAFVFGSLADVELDAGNLDDALGAYRASLKYGRELSLGRVVACSLAGIAAVAGASEAYETAARLWGAVETYEDERGATLPGVERARWERRVAPARAALPDVVAAGRRLTLEDAAALAAASAW